MTYSSILTDWRTAETVPESLSDADASNREAAIYLLPARAIWDLGMAETTRRIMDGGKEEVHG